MPGRIGTSSPELGVPVSFADVCDFMGICEVAFSEAGYSPELSYGSHLFQDLVEADIYYGAILEDPNLVYYDPGFTKQFTEVTSEIFKDTTLAKQAQGVVRVYETREAPLMLWHDLSSNTSICGINN